MDEALQGEIGDEVGGGEREHCGRTRGVSGFKPPLDRGAVVSYSGAQAYG